MESTPAKKKKGKSTPAKAEGDEARKSKSAAKTDGGLTLMQEEFCQLYVNADRELFGNGTQCYLATFGEQYHKEKKRPMKYEVACVLASKELSKVKVIARINELLSTGGFTDQNVDKQHLFLINQHADLKTKLGAIQEYNKLKSRIQKKIDITSDGKEIKGNTIILADFKDGADHK